jgi:hypothetical protein
VSRHIFCPGFGQGFRLWERLLRASRPGEAEERFTNTQTATISRHALSLQTPT